MNFIQLIQRVLGAAPTYFTISGSTTPQWDYGKLMEYFFSGMAMLLVILMMYKVIQVLIGFFVRRNSR